LEEPEVWDPWRKPFLESLERITPSTLRSRSVHSPVTARRMEATTQIQRPSVKHSISVLMTEMEAALNTPSFVLTGLCSNSNTSSVTGGSM